MILAMKELKIYFTTDLHGYVYPTDYTQRSEKNIGLLNIINEFNKDGNTLIIDAGDTIQGSPFTNYLSSSQFDLHPIAAIMNAGGYDFITLGNHDFNYGREYLKKYLNNLNATCLCANVTDTTGELPIVPYKIKTMENGLKIGLLGFTTDFINRWERPENIENISISFGNLTLFRGLDLQVHYGESVCICGGSGSGKSSLLKAVLGFVPLSEGTIKVDGTLLAPRTADHIRKKIAWIPQELALPSEWVSEMVRMPFELKANREAGFSKERLMDYFVSLGLEEKLYDKRVNEVSGGQRQRIMLAVTALLDKPLLVVDEPTSALDPESCLRVINFFKSLCSKGMTILSVSHDKQFAAGCDKVFTL